jgi:hypothetical protein
LNNTEGNISETSCPKDTAENKTPNNNQHFKLIRFNELGIIEAESEVEEVVLS